MESIFYLTFKLHNTLYGIDALPVQEIFYLPELLPLADAPPDVVGVVNLRGSIIPVLDLGWYLGQPSQNYALTDSVIVLQRQGKRVGLIVNQVQEVQQIEPEAIQSEGLLGRGVTTGIAQVGDALMTLLNLNDWLDRSSDGLDADNLDSDDLVNDRRFTFCPNASAEERRVFQERAANLAIAETSDDLTQLSPLAVVGLNGEYFGLDLELVQEFTDVRRVTPIPCCPPHILGNMNLRGEIVTLVDIRSVLNLPGNQVNTSPKAMIVHINDLVAGVVVDEVLDVAYVHSAQVKAIPTAVRSESDDYLRGTVAYGDHFLSILELPKLLAKPELMVDETV